MTNDEQGLVALSLVRLIELRFLLKYERLSKICTIKCILIWAKIFFGSCLYYFRIDENERAGRYACTTSI